MNLPEELATLIYPSKYHDLVAADRINWALSDLKISSLLNSPEHGKYQISDLGKQALSDYGLNITREYVHSLLAYVDQKRKLANKESAKNEIAEDQTFELTEKQVSDWFKKQASNLAEQLLTKLRNTDPYQFENMMVTMLSKMGYKGTIGQSLVTQKSNDGGIDGILNLDPLGLRKVYVQVKWYGKDNTVERTAISQFHGDLDLHGADNGVFITTSSFTAGAIKSAKTFNIALVNGEMLTNLMIQYKVGVQIHTTYALYDIDNDFFEE
ncbi:restriction endonuclease [uncultured Lactobacillus sp.]|uniref:restriction endonuclease n=1 Tax=uncultured Lactobacillus sp. TaxID=153152 RepID=UPI00259BF221|nr:restriction endonuclease [uncultured Lactobacillus sp.]